MLPRSSGFTVGDVRWAFATALFGRRDVRRVLGVCVAEDVVVTVLQLREGYAAAWRDGRPALVRSTLGEIVDALSPAATIGLGFGPDEARRSERFDDVADRIRRNDLQGARSLALDALAELDRCRGSAEPLGYGARPEHGPAISLEDLAARFEEIADSLRSGAARRARALCADACVALADWLAIAEPERSAGEVHRRAERPVSRLHGFFSASVEQVRDALAALDDADADNHDRSWGAVQSPEDRIASTGKPAAGGLDCAVIFGPVDEDRCVCGALDGPSQRGAVCPKCHVEVGDSAARDWRFGHLELPEPLRHPTVELPVASIPVLPPGHRPHRVHHQPLRLEPHPVQQVYRHLVARRNRLARLLELGAPAILVDAQREELQQTFARLLGAVRGEPIHPDSPADAEASERKPARLVDEAPDTDGAVTALLWLDDERLLVQRPTGIVLLTNGRVTERRPPDSRRLTWTDGHRVVLVGDHAQVEVVDGSDHHAVVDVGVLDWPAGRWLQRWPDDLPAVLVQRGDPEDAWLADAHTGGGPVVGAWSDRPTAEAYSRDGRVIWISDGGYGGALVQAASGHEIASGPRDQPELAFDVDRGEVVDDDTADEPELDHGAIGRLDDEWIFASSDGVVGAGDFAFFRLVGSVRALAFHPDGQLTIATDDRVVLLRIDEDDRPADAIVLST